MAIFGLGFSTSKTGHKCYKCGKMIKAGVGFSKKGSKYCHDTCCNGKSKQATKRKAKGCEFC